MRREPVSSQVRDTPCWILAQRARPHRLAAMDFSLTQEQQAIQETVRQFTNERILPNATENDQNHYLDMSVIEGMAELGLLGIVVPEEYGGAGLDFVSEAIVCEEIERGENAFRTLISVHVGLNSLSLLKYGTEEQKQRYLVPQAKGEKLGCFGLDRARRGLRRRRDARFSAREGRGVPAQRPENLDLVRRRRRHGAGVRENRSGRGSQGHHRVPDRARVARRHREGHSRQARRLGRVDRRAVLRERRGTGPRM